MKFLFFGRLFRVGLVFLFGLSVAVKAQNYPLLAQVNLLPPYAVSLQSLAGADEKIQATLLHKDFATPDIEVYLKFKLSLMGIKAGSQPARSAGGAWMSSDG